MLQGPVSGTGPGTMYGLPKIHKINFNTEFPFRPIIAAYNTAAYKLSKFLVPLLTPFTINEYTVHNSYDFAQMISNFPNADGLFMCSFDIQNLFTNIPLNETITITLELLFPSENHIVSGMNKLQFKKLLEICTKNSIFLFNQELYRQVDGVGMGLPHSPTFANLFLCYMEKQWLSDCPSHFKPVLYKRYVDDTFLLFRDRQHSVQFLNYLNNKHININFTCESEESNTLPFLDIAVTRSGCQFSTSIYRKPTFSNLGISFFSFCPINFKINAIKTLVYRAYHLCSNYALFHIELEFLKQFFIDNGFPSKLFYSITRNFIDKTMYLKNQCNNNQSLNSKNIYLSLPYFGYQSQKMKSEFMSLLNNMFNNVKPFIVLSNKRTIGSMFKYKDSIPEMFRSCVIYKYTCPLCGAVYVGSTTRTLHTRMSEHLGISSRTGQHLSVPPHSSIRSHSEHTCNSSPSKLAFSIIDSDNNPISLRIKESIYIHSLKPALNESLSAYPLHILH